MKSVHRVLQIRICTPVVPRSKLYQELQSCGMLDIMQVLLQDNICLRGKGEICQNVTLLHQPI